jgi:hypothetical protein
VRAPSSFCSMICIFVCRSVTFFGSFITTRCNNVTCFSPFRAHVYKTNFSTEFQLCFARKILFVVSLSSLFHSKTTPSTTLSPLKPPPQKKKA